MFQAGIHLNKISSLAEHSRCDGSSKALVNLCSLEWITEFLKLLTCSSLSCLILEELGYLWNKIKKKTKDLAEHIPFALHSKNTVRNNQELKFRRDRTKLKFRAKPHPPRSKSCDSQNVTSQSNITENLILKYKFGVCWLQIYGNERWVWKTPKWHFKWW